MKLKIQIHMICKRRKGSSIHEKNYQALNARNIHAKFVCALNVIIRIFPVKCAFKTCNVIYASLV